MPGVRSRPGWVITEDFVDEELGVLRAGKEAGCFLVRRMGAERWCLLVRKDYRKRSDRTYNAPVRAGERGVRRDAYERAGAIQETIPAFGGGYNDARQRRAVAKRTSFGKTVREAAWARHEFETLQRLWVAGASVPYPVEASDHGFLMQYVGTLSGSAPRLADARLEPAEAATIFEHLLSALRVFAREGIVHGDLSAYNVLVQHGRPWVIDMPQAVDLFAHPSGEELFARDVVNICTYFNRAGVPCDADRVTADLLYGD